MQESSIRGLHAFGVAYWNDAIHTIKQFDLNVEELLTDFVEYSCKSLIFHARYDTSGDWHNMQNNQPIVLCNENANVAIAMNGVLSMKPKNEYEKEFDVKCNTENDAEVFLQKMSCDYDVLNFLKQQSTASFAATFLLDNQVFALRNNKRPLHWFKKHDAVYVCSTRNIAERALKDNTKINVLPAWEWFDLNAQL